MTKQIMNEAERFLLEHWGDARLLEESMETVRGKYKELFEQVVEAVTEAHPEIDSAKIYVTQFWSDGQIGFGRKQWPSDKNGNPCGFWMVGLRLESLTAEESEGPTGSIWIPKKCNIDLNAARKQIDKEAKKLLSAKELEAAYCTDSEEVALWLPAPSKQELLASLIEGNGQKFVGLFVAQFDLMARFVPVLDKVFRECVTGA